LHIYAFIGIELDDIETSKGGSVLVLFAYRFLEEVDFKVTSLLSSFGGVKFFVGASVETMEESYGKAGRGAEAGPGGDIGEGAYLHTFFGEIEVEESGFDAGMVEMARVRGLLCFFVFDDKFIHEIDGIDKDVDEFVDGCRNDATRVGFIEVGEVSAAADETEA
jgi:hypothetical protein